MLLLLLLPTPCWALKFTAVEKTAIENTQAGVLNLNNKFGDFNTQLSALSNNVFSLSNSMSAVLKMQTDIQANIGIKLTGIDKSIDNSVKANRDMYQNTTSANDSSIFYWIIGALVAGYFLFG